MRIFHIPLFVLILFQSLLGQTYDQIQEANELYSSNELNEARTAYEVLVSENPMYGDFNFKLGLIYQKLGQFLESNHYFQASIKLGYRAPYAIKCLAANYAQLGELDESLKWIKKGLETPKSITYTELLKDKSFENIRNSMHFQKVYPLISDDLNRIVKWNVDLEFLRTAIQQNYYNLSKNQPDQDWDLLLAQLQKSVGSLSDIEIIAKLFRITAALGDGHTFVRPPLSGELSFHHFPIKLYQFKEGVHIISAAEDFKEWIGVKVLSIQNKPIEEIIESFKSIISVDNNMGFKENINLFMLAELLVEAGVSFEENTITVKVLKGEKIHEFNIQANSFDPVVWSGLPVSEQKTPLWATRSNEMYWFEELTDSEALYMHINFNYSAGPYDIEEFYDSAFHFMKEKELERLVIDLRNCPGGNSFTNKRLIEHILSMPNLNKKGNLFTVIGRKTFSAAMNLTSDLEYWTETLFIGEPTGSSPNFIGETNFITLPYSLVNVSISNAYWQGSTSWDQRKWKAPEILKEPSIQEYQSGKDSVLNFIVDFWSKG